MRWSAGVWLVLCMLALGLDSSAAGKPNDRAWKSKQKDCEKTACAHLVPDEAQNCVNQCVSRACYEQIYGDEPLEDGEIDTKRARAFTGCVRKEYRGKKRSWAATAADEKQRLDSLNQADDD